MSDDNFRERLTSAMPTPDHLIRGSLTQVLLDALKEARPYVFNQTRRTDGVEDWRTQTAQGVLARVDAALEPFKRRRE